MRQIAVFLIALFLLPIFDNAQNLQKRLKVEKSIVLLKNQNNLLPLINLDSINLKIRPNNNYDKIFIKSAKRYMTINTNFYNRKDIRIVIIYNNLASIKNNEDAVFIVIGNSKNLIPQIDTLPNVKALIYSPLGDSLSIDYLGQLIFGAFSINNKLKENISAKYKKGYGLPLKGNIRLKYTIPAELGLDSAFIFNRIDSIANYAISHHATPGCQILAAKDQKVFFYKCYGYHTYDSVLPVVDSNLYDLASVTKIAATAPCLMKLAQEHKFDINKKFYKYWRPFKHSNKKNLTIIDALCHQGRLQAWIPFWKYALDKNNKLSDKYFSSDSCAKFPTKVAENLYIRRKYYKHIFKQIKKSALLPEKKYKYSDLSFYLYPQIIEKLTNKSFEECLKSNFYEKLGSTTMCFNPLRFYSKDAIIPTEYDKFFRKQLLLGYVHDEGAAMMGGVSGHAGLFSNANDLAKLMQMYCNYGKYGGIRYIDSGLVREWTTYQFPENKNRRAIIFDKLPLDLSINATPSPLASRASFGHSGFTGTFAWADPETGLIFIFLSNRVYPTRQNKKLLTENIRTNIHTILYKAIYKTQNLK